MHPLLILIAVIFNASFLLSQTQKPLKLKYCNTVSVAGKNILIDATEISTGEWLSFIYQMYYNEETQLLDVEYAQVLPDTNILPEKYKNIIRLFQRHTISPFDDMWKQLKQVAFSGHNSFMAASIPLLKKELDLKDSLNYKNLLELPIVGIAFTQVQKYLNWRNQIVLENHKDVLKNYKITCRLLYQEEWTYLSNTIGPRLKGNNSEKIDTIGTEKCYVLNIKPTADCKGRNSGVKKYGEGVFGIYSYWPDNIGLYQFFGNVSEMTNKEGISVGGGFIHYGAECFPNKFITYSKPEAWLGFRCVFEYTKK